jgi:hypothetical protein
MHYQQQRSGNSTIITHSVFARLFDRNGSAPTQCCHGNTISCRTPRRNTHNSEAVSFTEISQLRLGAPANTPPRKTLTAVIGSCIGGFDCASLGYSRSEKKQTVIKSGETRNFARKVWEVVSFA